MANMQVTHCVVKEESVILVSLTDKVTSLQVCNEGNFVLNKHKSVLLFCFKLNEGGTLLLKRYCSLR